MPKDKTQSAMTAMESKGDNAPSGYKPLTVDQRNQWNGFLRYLYSKGLSGNKQLDDGPDQTATLISNYKSMNPSFSITPDMVPHIQYEMTMMKAGKIPDANGKFTSTGSGAGNLIPNLFSRTVLSPVDGRIGSLTSAEPYPIADLNGKSWGTDYSRFLRDMAPVVNRGSKNTNSDVALTAMSSN
jgi:hypothetical protein